MSEIRDVAGGSPGSGDVHLMDVTVLADPGCFLLCESGNAAEMRWLVSEPLVPGRKVLLMLNRYPEGARLGNRVVDEMRLYSETIVVVETDR